MEQVPGQEPAAGISDLPSVPKEDSQSRLDDLTAQATLKYSVKDYSAAAELYSQASELQGEINGEMSPQNADLLYAYGRCLYHVAVSNSDVLGTKVAGEKREAGSNGAKAKGQGSKSDFNGRMDKEERIAEEVVTKVVEEKDGVKEAQEDGKPEDKPYFQFTGDENFDESDGDVEEAEDGEGEVEAADEEDDFVVAYEILDLARVLLVKKLDEAEEQDGNGKSKTDSAQTRHLKERLADTHDLIAEISLEGEKFPAAIVDLQAALALKKELYPQDSSLVAEAHYKLSLALEFSSITQQKGAAGEVEEGAQVDEAMRESAMAEMESAITSCKLRIQREEAGLASAGASESVTIQPKVTRQSIDDVKEVVKDMEQRLVELRQPPVSINGASGTDPGSNLLSGILGGLLGESPEGRKIRLEEASKNANDVTNLVKRKKPPASDGAKEAPKTNGKRKVVEFAEEVEEVGTGKKAKTQGADG